MTARSRRALAAALAVAAEHGLRCEEPEILRDASNLLVRLRPAPVVARVMTVTSTIRHGDAWLARELAIASHLAVAGAPVVAPSAELAPGPHHHDGVVLSFWTYVDEGDRPLDAAEAGRRLRTIHDELRHFAYDDLPRLAVLDEADRVVAGLDAAGALDPADAKLLRRAGAAVRARIERLGLPLQAIHGDAHLHNVINGPDGPLWNDWEDCFLGPRGWDLGCLVATARAFGRAPAPVQAAVAGYDPDLGDDALDAFVEARRYQGGVWSIVMTRENPDEERRARAADMLAWYREQA